MEQAIKQTGHQAENVLSYTALSFPVQLRSSRALSLDNVTIAQEQSGRLSTV